MILQPPNDEHGGGPLIFLAGPIQGTDPWQTRAAGIIETLDPDIKVANPRREYLDEDFIYEDQVDWETRLLAAASFNGAILFWLARETDHVCDRSYAQTTRFELGEWILRVRSDPYAEIVVGIEDGFTGARYIRHRLENTRVPVCHSLQGACFIAAKIATQEGR